MKTTPDRDVLTALENEAGGLMAGTGARVLTPENLRTMDPTTVRQEAEAALLEVGALQKTTVRV